MDAPRLAVRLGVAASLALLVGLVALSIRDDRPAARLPIEQEGSPIVTPTEPGYLVAEWNGGPVAVIVVPKARLEGVEIYRGAGEATPSIEVPGHPDLRLFALSAKSTHRGCTVGFNAGLGASRDIADYDGDGVLDGRMIDPCSQSQWDPYHRGEVLPGMPAKVRLAVLDVALVDGMLVATHFDGPVGGMAG